MAKGYVKVDSERQIITRLMRPGSATRRELEDMARAATVDASNGPEGGWAYDRPGYPFARHAGALRWEDGWDIQVRFQRRPQVVITNRSPHAEYVDQGNRGPSLRKFITPKAHPRLSIKAAPGVPSAPGLAKSGGFYRLKRVRTFRGYRLLDEAVRKQLALRRGKTVR